MLTTAAIDAPWAVPSSRRASTANSVNAANQMAMWINGFLRWLNASAATAPSVATARNGASAPSAWLREMKHDRRC